MHTFQILFYLVSAATIGLAFYSLFTLVKKVFSPEIRLTNRETGKSVILPRHHYNGLAKKILEVVE
ncbi:hypothetical protein [Dyadobacter luticola]|uniref:Uncharacterized protein n=1 Tax=Dyadobacter luticola TaxID=1979387 RepID=A0A5R9L2L3_9BACT|nr:hypothetical protein [Dyadobacter luticola]TLV02824.1 hypothetical protein FEN17_04180 [Dyadobacter luticola]